MTDFVCQNRLMAEAKDNLPSVQRPPGDEGLSYSTELRRTFARRNGYLLAFFVNLSLAGVFLAVDRYDPQRGSVRVAGFAAELAAWAIAGTICTNQLGGDSEQVLVALRGRTSIVQILVVKSLVLATLLLPVTLVIALVVEVDLSAVSTLPEDLTLDLLDVYVVLLWLGVGSVTSVLIPYRPIPLRTRWRARDTWARWAFVQVVPYLAFFLVLPGLTYPVERFTADMFGNRVSSLVEYSSSFAGYGFLVWGAGLVLAMLYARLAPHRLLSDLQRDNSLPAPSPHPHAL